MQISAWMNRKLERSAVISAFLSLVVLGAGSSRLIILDNPTDQDRVVDLRVREQRRYGIEVPANSWRVEYLQSFDRGEHTLLLRVDGKHVEGCPYETTHFFFADDYFVTVDGAEEVVCTDITVAEFVESGFRMVGTVGESRGIARARYYPQRSKRTR